MIDTVAILQNLIRCESITPVDAGAQAYLAEALRKLGFACHHLTFNGVPNLFARLGNAAPHLCFAGHTDVVPPGPVDQWTHGPFNPVIENGRIYGRGASDMKGAIACFTAAMSAWLAKNETFKGSISFLITGDEEGPATDGTVKVLDWMEQNNHLPDVALVGEPTNPTHLGQEIKIGRRGSLSGDIIVRGKQGHAAYPHLADNPLPRLVMLLGRLCDYTFDEGTEFFEATNLEVVSIDTGNAAYNVIPASANAKFNVRFNDRWTARSMQEKIKTLLASNAPCEITFLEGGAESFLSSPGEWADLVKRAVKDITGLEAKFTTGGGTSDARFVQKYCPVVELGAVNKTIHQIDESAELKDLEGLTNIYERVLELYLGAAK